MRTFHLLFFSLAIALFTCTKSKSSGDLNPPVPVTTTEFVKDADIGWLTQMEAAGRKFYSNAFFNKKGEFTELLKIYNDLNKKFLVPTSAR